MPLPLLALLHEGGWDEMIMVAVGLIVAYAVIAWTGRRSQTDEEDEDITETEDERSLGLAESKADGPSPRPDEPPRAAP